MWGGVKRRRLLLVEGCEFQLNPAPCSMPCTLNPYPSPCPAPFTLTLLCALHLNPAPSPSP